MNITRFRITKKQFYVLIALSFVTGMAVTVMLAGLGFEIVPQVPEHHGSKTVTPERISIGTEYISSII